jgi:hypothetical protein
MTHVTHGNEGRISRVHIAALCKEIAERLGTILGQQTVKIPAHLLALMKRLRDEPSRIQRDLKP